MSDDVLRALFILLDIAGTEVVSRGPEDGGFAYYLSFMKLRRIHATGFWCAATTMPCRSTHS